MSGETYLLGLVVIVAIAGPPWLVARRLRAGLLPDWSGPQAWLADAVVGVALLEAIAQLLGTPDSSGADPWSRPRWDHCWPYGH